MGWEHTLRSATSTAMKEETLRRYVIVEYPDGDVSIAVNHEVKPDVSLHSQTTSCEEDGEGDNFSTTDAQTFLEWGMRSTRGIHGAVDDDDTCKPVALVFACIFFMTAMVNVYLHHRPIDIISVVLSFATFNAIRFDTGWMSRCELALHGTFSMSVIPPLAVYHHWGQVGYQAGCASLCFAYLFATRET